MTMMRCLQMTTVTMGMIRLKQRHVVQTDDPVKHLMLVI